MLGFLGLFCLGVAAVLMVAPIAVLTVVVLGAGK